MHLEYPFCSDWSTHIYLQQHRSLYLWSALYCFQLPVSFTSSGLRRLRLIRSSGREELFTCTGNLYNTLKQRKKHQSVTGLLQSLMPSFCRPAINVLFPPLNRRAQSSIVWHRFDLEPIPRLLTVNSQRPCSHSGRTSVCWQIINNWPSSSPHPGLVPQKFHQGNWRSEQSLGLPSLCEGRETLIMTP